MINKRMINSDKTDIIPFKHTSDFILYTTPNGTMQIEPFLRNETIWLTQKLMAESFDVDRTNIGRHLKNIFQTNEIIEKVVCAKIAHTTEHGAIEEKIAINKDNFKELLARTLSIREIKRQIEQQIMNCFAEYSIDYHRDSSITATSYSTIQNKCRRKAVNEYTELNKSQKIKSDFDRVVKQLNKGNKA